MTIRRLGSAVLEVVHDGLPHDGGERIGRGMTRFALRDAQAFLAPVDVVASQGGDFASAKAIGHQQQQDGIVPSACWGSAVDRLQQATDLIPGDRARDLGQTVGLW